MQPTQHEIQHDIAQQNMAFLSSISKKGHPHNTNRMFHGHLRDECGTVNLFGMRERADMFNPQRPASQAFGNRCDNCGSQLHDAMCGCCGNDYLPC